jgi:hypothetical protein
MYKLKSGTGEAQYLGEIDYRARSPSKYDSTSEERMSIMSIVTIDIVLTFANADTASSTRFAISVTFLTHSTGTRGNGGEGSISPSGYLITQTS